MGCVSSQLQVRDAISAQIQLFLTHAMLAGSLVWLGLSHTVSEATEAGGEPWHRVTGLRGLS